MTLLLLPNLLDPEGTHHRFLPASVDQAVARLDGIIAESEKQARAFLRRFAFPAPKTFREVPIRLLNEHTKEAEVEALLEPLLRGECWGVVSDAGLPCLADPGALLVSRARRRGIAIEAFVGPSSLVLALQLSGLPAQAFAFHGYLQKEEAALIKQLQMLEKRSAQERATQLFIEAPYRNQKMLGRLLGTLREETLLCVAWDLTMPTQGVISQSVQLWKKQPQLPSIDKRPAVFLLFGG